MRLLYIANSQRYKTNEGWSFPKWTKIDRKSLMLTSGWKDRRTFQRVRDELVTAGYIKFKSGQGIDITEYLLIALLTANDKEKREDGIKNKSSNGSFDTEDFFAAAIRASLEDD